MAFRGGNRIGRSHGQRVPPLINVIKNTLRNYPDGSQILKELIQNADDACATEVEFLLDCTQHSSENLIHPSLDKYQGPALYAWNNSVFGEEDWEGIRNISVSRKENVVLKVGRFALGFISVYHITDFPCIISNEDVLLLDPHMVIDPTGGIRIRLDEFITETSCTGHLQTFLNYFGYGGTAKYNGTIFRFPLRSGLYETSLPNTIYTPDRVIEALFDPFRQEIENCLLFLKSVTSIRVSIMKVSGISPLYSAEIDSGFRERLLRHRKEMFQFVEKGGHLTASYVYLSIFPTSFTSGVTKQNIFWLVLNILGVGQNSHSNQLRTSFSKQSGSYLPWFALALPLPYNSDYPLNITSGASGLCWAIPLVNLESLFKSIDDIKIPFIPFSHEVREFIGNLFCFLPISARSNFPFHVHGYFAISTNRRSIKWPTFDDHSEESSWNMHLVNCLGTQCYAIMLYFVISKFQFDKHGAFQYSLWSCLPSKQDSQQLSGILHRGALELIQNTSLVFMKNCCKWIQLECALYPPSSFNIRIPHESVCNDLLVALSQPVVEVSIEIANVIKRYEFLERKTRSRLITSSMIRKFLIDFKDNTQLLYFLRTKENVFSLLEIVLDDVKFPCRNVSTLLNGIRLIPICNLELPETFGGNKYYISERPQKHLKLFPGLENKFVEPDLPPNISVLLLKLSRTGAVNLKDITDIRNDPALFVELLEKSMRTFFSLTSPITWTPGICGPGREWIELLWQFINGTRIIEKLKMRNFPILPKQDILPSRVAFDLLSISTSRLPYVEKSGESAYQEIEGMLEECGCHVCERNGFIPSFYDFVYQPLPRGLLPILQFLNIRQLFQQKLSNADNSVRTALRRMILSIELQDSHVNLAKSFPIFISISNRWVTMDRFNQYYLPPDNVPREFSQYPENFLSPFSNLNVQLCEKVGLVKLSLDEVVQHHLMPILCTENISNFPLQRNLLSLWVLSISPNLAQDALVVLLSKKWLLDSTTDSDQASRVKLYSPRELFYPNDPLITKLNASVAFPNKIYDACLHILKWLGLQTGESLSYDSLKTIVNSSLQNIPHTRAEYTNWLDALLEFLHIHFDRLKLSGNREFWGIFQRARFIKPSSLCESYPACLPFYPHTNYFSVPSQITLCSDKEACLIAGVAPVLVKISQTETNLNIYKCMGIQTSVTPTLVCEQVRLVVETFREKGGSLDHSQIHSLMKKIYKYLGKNIEISSLITTTEFSTIFIPKQGFVKLEQIVLSCHEISFHIYSLDQYYNISDSHISAFFNFLKISPKIDQNKCHYILQRLSTTDLSPEDINLTLSLINLYNRMIVLIPTPGDCLILAQDSKIYPAKDCIFNDLKWMEHSPLLATERVVHQGIPHSIANKFGCRPASSVLAPVTESFGFGCGQSENFVDRLKGILKGYRMQMDVFKELIQNSDDAEAHQVKILFDYSSYSCESILDPKMGEVQGPALYFFNDAQFTPEDLDSIIKLSKGTKLSMTDKIGRFGVGFNAVYNFTDCPSFISGEIVQIFDPLQVYTGNFRRNSGVRFRYVAGDTRKLKTYHDLFEVYDGIFGCDILKSHPYPHTLFRLPFRKNPSKLSDITFDEDGISELQNIVRLELEYLILFLQNISCIEVYERKRRGDIRCIIRVSKSECQTIHFLKNNKEHFQKYLNVYRPRNIVSSSDVVSVYSESHSGKTCQRYLLSYASGTGACFNVLVKFAQSRLTFLPLCGVAIPLSFLESIPKPPLCFIYTFLPLPIHSPFPVHINGYFSLSDSRKNLSDASGGRIQDLPTEWNLALINDALPNALISALEKLHTLAPLHESSDPRVHSNYFSLWPVASSTEFLWRNFPQKFAERIVNTYFSIKLFSSAKDPKIWVTFRECSFLSLQTPLSNNEDFLNCIYTLCSSITFANLPNLFYSSELFSIFSRLQPEKVYDLKKVIDVIFPQLNYLNIQQLVVIFNSLVPLCNAEPYSWLFQLLQREAFIPCSKISGSGFVLRRPSEVVFPKSKISRLFHPQDENQPVPQLQNRFDLSKKDVFVQVLRNMGVMCDCLTESGIVGRCTITTKLDPCSATQHAFHLIEYLYMAVIEDKTLMQRIYKDIENIPFIPTYRDPLYDICQIRFDIFAEPRNCYPFNKHHLVTPKSPSASDMVRDISTFLPILTHTPLEIVLEVLEILVSSDDVSASLIDLSPKMSTIYSYLAQIHSSNLGLIRRKLSNICWVFHPGNRRFYPTDRTIISPDLLEFQTEYLISFPFRDLLNDINFGGFLQKIGMKNCIDDDKIITCLDQLHQTFADNILSNDLVNFVLKLIRFIRDPANCSANIYILNRECILKPPNQLFVSFSPHLEEFLTEGDSKSFVHEKIHPQMAFKLGVKPSEQLFSNSFEFGLQENITDRIQNLVREMTMSSLVKELIQNAEDAGATEIVFILDDQDYRNFDSRLCITNSLFPNWKNLNSFPSLCVYNNSGFSDEDLEGIQNLSVGGKGGERNSIGKFGLGFSSVYRITDAPTFITSKASKDGLTFCCFDPFLKYTAAIPAYFNYERKRGRRDDIKFVDKAKFADQIYPFEFRKFKDNSVLCESLANLWNNGDFTMFRLPLDIEQSEDSANTQDGVNSIYRKKEIRKHYSLREISDNIVRCIRECPEMILFLRKVKKLKVISIDKWKKISLLSSLTLEQSNAIGRVENWFPPFELSCNMQIKQISLLNIKVNKYLVYSIPGVAIEEYLEKDKSLRKFSGTLIEEKLSGFGGVAVCFFPLRASNCKLFSFLPLDSCSNFPVHINAPLILDSSRQNVHDRTEDWENSWHSSVARCLIVPLYAKFLLDLRYPERAIELTPANEKDYYNWYYSLFPSKTVNPAILSQVSQELYRVLYRSNHELLLAHDLDISENRFWYPLHGTNCGVFKPSRFFSMPKQDGQVGGVIDQCVYSEFNKRENQIRKSLVLIKYPLTFAPSRILTLFEPQLKQLDQIKLLSYLISNTTVLFNQIDTINLSHSILEFEQIQLVLEYILTAEDLDSKVIPLRVDISDNVRDFSRETPSYLPYYASLLPQRSEDFVSEKYSPHVIFKLKTLGFVRSLDVDYLAQHLATEVDASLCVKFWKFMLENQLNQDGLNKFLNHKLIPLKKSRFCPVKCLKFVLSETLGTKEPILFSALKKLGCQILSFDFFIKFFNESEIEKFTSFLDSIAISESRTPETIIESLLLLITNPDHLEDHLEDPLDSEEASKLVQIFSQLKFNSLQKNQLAIISKLKIFLTLSGDYYSLNQCDICFVDIGILRIGQTILDILLNEHKLVVFHPCSSQVLVPLCPVIDKMIIDVNDLLLNFVFTFMTEIPFGEKLSILSYISSVLAGGNRENISVLLSTLSEIPFIRTDNIYKVKDLYAPEIAFIKTFLPQLSFPKDWAKQYNLKELFVQLGLQEHVSLHCIFEIAQLFSVFQIQRDLGILLDQLTVNLNEIKWNEIEDSDTSRILNKIGNIPFLPSGRINQITQVCTISKLAKFGDAQQKKYHYCCCTTDYIHSFSFNFPTESYGYLNIIEEPDPNLVEDHLKNISKDISENCEQNGEGQIQIVMPSKYEEYFTSSYSFLEKHFRSCEFAEFHKLRCILWDNTLYYPINMLFTSSEELKPFILQIPPKLAADYPNLMSRLGVKEKANYSHFAYVLFQIHHHFQNVALNGSDYERAECLFNSLIKDLRKLNTDSPPSDLDLSRTMLLTMNSELRPSTEVIYADKLSLLSRANKLELDFNILNTLQSDEKGSCAPPACLRLKKLSEILLEELAPSLQIIQPTELNKFLEDMITSPNFYRVLRRLYYHLTNFDLDNLFLNNGETFLKNKDNTPPEGYCPVIQVLRKLNIISVKCIDLIFYDNLSKCSRSMQNACSCYIDKNTFYLSEIHSMDDFILEDIVFLIDGYLGDIFKEVRNCFQLCFKTASHNLSVIMNKLDEYNIRRDPWSLPKELNPALAGTNLSGGGSYGGGSYGGGSSGIHGLPRARPEGISLGEPDIPSAKLAFKVSQCDLFAARKLITKCQNNINVFPAHACFLCYESLIKAFKALLHLRGSSNRLTNIRDIRKHLEFVKFILSKDHPQLFQRIEQLTLPLLNCNIDTCGTSTLFLPTIGCLIPQQIFSLSQAKNAIENTDKVISLLKSAYPVLNAASLLESDSILTSSESAIITAIRAVVINQENCYSNLTPDCEEFKAISLRFYDSMPDALILSIKKIHNFHCWSAFRDKVIQECKRHGDGCLNFQFLFHGTGNHNPDEIAKDPVGFNLRYAQGGLWGDGIYFAYNSSYSHQNYSFQSRDDTCCLIAAFVFVGYSKELVEDRRITGPPLIPNSGERYHSVQGVRNGEVIHTIYESCMAYPAYTIAYKPRN